MAMRRPRIKPVANIQLNSKRKPKTTNDVKTVKSGESDVNGHQEVEKQVNVLSKEKNDSQQTEQVSDSNKTTEEVRVDTTVDTTANVNNLNDKNENNGIGADQSSQNVEVGTDHLTQNIEKVNENENNKSNNEIVENTVKVNKASESIGNEHLKCNNKNELKDALNDSDAFKCPPKVGIQRAISHTSNSGVDDVFYSDIEENALQMDLEKSPIHSPMSPSKNLTRQRIRPTPHFGQRRNSFVGSSPSPHTSGNEDNNTNVNNEFVQPTQTRRERHHSASFSSNNHTAASSHHHFHHTPHKYLPSGISHGSMGRIRTESGCSVFSDTNTSSHKSRKTEDSKQNTRKDFEARFHNGVPEKSAIKMSDLIYYNPATNPMEQKPNPSVKLEQSEASANDVKPFTEKVEKDVDSSADGEAIPVPQLKLNAKGELILDDKSLVIETTAEQEARKVLANSSLIYLDENTGMNGFYSRQKRTREWLPSETIKFYRCLQNVGTDFSLMVSLFPNRTRRDLKLKFKKEERKNGNLINKALLYPKQFDLESLKQQIDEEEKLREEQAQKTKMLKEKAKESKKRKICTSSVSNRILLNEDIYQNENDQKPKKARKSNSNKNSSESTLSSETGEQNVETDKNGETNYNLNDAEQKSKQKRSYKKSKNVSKNANGEQIVENNINNNNGEITQTDEDVEVDKIKRRRRRTPNKTQKEEIIIIKEEIIKIENKQDSNQTMPTIQQPEYQDTKQLQTEIDELLDSDAVDIQYNTNNSNHHATYETAATNMFPVATPVPQYTEHIHNSSPCSMSYTPTYIQDNYVHNDMDINKYEHRTFVNLDDGSVNVYSKLEDDTNYNTTNSPSISTPAQIPNLPSPPNRSQSPTISNPQAPIEYSFNNEYATNDETISPTTPNTNIIPEPEIINNDTCSSVISERELNEEDIQSILTELADGSLVLVSSLDPDDPDKVLNEIYMVDKNTGELCDEPLNIPDNIVQCILTVVS